MIPIALISGQIFAGVLFAIGLILLGWYPVKHLCSLSKNKKIKISHLENGSCKLNEMKPLQAKSYSTKQHTQTLDGSPLLEKPDKIIISNSNTDDSLNTTSTAISYQNK